MEKTGQRIGPWTWTNASGQVIFKVSYNGQGQEHGEAVRYSSAGQVLTEVYYVHGALEGTAREWWPGTQHLKEEKSYKAGELHGVRRRWSYDAKARPDCGPEQKADKHYCWVGSQECWIGGERRAHEDCVNLYAVDHSKASRSIASQH